jgi:hypothetical protein
MGVQTMNKQSENKVTKTDTIDKSKQRFVTPTKDELNEQELEKASGGGGAFLRFDFKSVSVKTISWSHSSEAPKEEVTLEYGGIKLRYL